MPRFFRTRKIRSLSVLFLSIIAALFTVSTSFGFSFKYIITQLTNNSYDDYYCDINDDGYVVWQGYDGSDAEIFLYDGTDTTQLTDNNYDDMWPHINNNGYVVWQRYDGSDYEIFLYDGTDTTRLTYNNYFDYGPQINNNGYVAWIGHPRESADVSDTEIFLYDGTDTTQLTDNSYDDQHCDINDDGYVVWQGYDGSDDEIFLYDGTDKTQLTDNNYDDIWPHINNDGYVVWQGLVLSTTYEIFLYDGTSRTRLTYNNYSEYGPQINNNGYVAWIGRVGGSVSDTEIFLYDGTDTTQLTDNSYSDHAYDINDDGYVVWQGYDGSDFEIFLYDGTSKTQLTDNNYDDIWPRINNEGCIAWCGYVRSGHEIFLACPFLNLGAEPVVDVNWEGYWGFWEPRVILPVPVEVEIDIPDEPEPFPCPTFSRIWRPNKMPSRLRYLHQEGYSIFAKAGKSKFPKRKIERLITLLEEIPAGQRYSESMRQSVVKAMKGLKDWGKEASSLSGELLQAMNAVELDWRVPSLSAQKVKRDNNVTANFRGVAWVTFKEVKKSGNMSLKVEGNLPAVVKGSRPVWPVASYHFDFTGQLADYVDISFYFGGYSFKGGIPSLHIFEWDGKSYKDITTIVDMPGKVITGRTNKLASYVIMSPVLGREALPKETPRLRKVK